MVRRYAHLAADHLAPYAEKFVSPVDGCARNFGHNLVTVGKMKGLASTQALDLMVAESRFGAHLRVPLDANARWHAAKNRGLALDTERFRQVGR